ncbi:hypothetical protein HDV06_000913 [Boothiomyces sp. JEL0866]|nr:hypothetical protein HDV06_000913 [Boothiomyces sp. JEL0866]
MYKANEKIPCYLCSTKKTQLARHIANKCILESEKWDFKPAKVSACQFCGSTAPFPEAKYYVSHLKECEKYNSIVDRSRESEIRLANRRISSPAVTESKSFPSPAAKYRSNFPYPPIPKRNPVPSPAVAARNNFRSTMVAECPVVGLVEVLNINGNVIYRLNGVDYPARVSVGNSTVLSSPFANPQACWPSVTTTPYTNFSTHNPGQIDVDRYNFVNQMRNATINDQHSISIVDPGQSIPTAINTAGQPAATLDEIHGYFAIEPVEAIWENVEQFKTNNNSFSKAYEE